MEKIFVNDQISGVHVGEFPVYTKKENFLDSEIFGIPLKFIAIAGAVLFAFKKMRKKRK